MKKSFLALAALGALTFTSCSDDIAPDKIQDGTEVSVRLTAQLPGEIGSRAVSDGLKTENLRYAVYELDATGAPVFVSDGTATFNGTLQTTVDLKLLSGRGYQFVFWADKTGADDVYTFNKEDRTITVSYTGVKANDEDRDAFFGKYEIAKVSGPITDEIRLTRPFAQVNIGTDDWETAQSMGVNKEEAPVKLSTVTTKAYESFNLFTGEVTGEIKEVNFDYAELLPNVYTVASGEDYETLVTKVDGETKYFVYLAMNYILMAPDQETVDVSFAYKRNDADVNDYKLEVNNVPVQRNYRTNIVGSLLTDPAHFDVIKVPEYTDDIIVRPVDLPDGTKVNLAFADVTLEDGTELKSAAIVNTPEEFLAANVLSAETVYVPEEATVDLSQRPAPIEITGKTTIYINGTVNTSRAQILATGADADVTVIGNGIESSRSTGKGTLQSVGTPTSSRPINALNGAKLTVRDLNVVAQQNSGGSAIFSENADVTLERVNVTCHNFAVGANGGTLYAKDCIFNTDSNNREGAFSYCVGINAGCQAVLEDCHIIGIQGGLSVQDPGSMATVKGGRYETLAHPTYGDGITFYPVYTCWGSKVLIESGEFICGNPNRWSVYCGNNDVPPLDSYGAAELRGGKYNTPTWDDKVKTAIEMPEGYEWIEKEDGEFKYAVVAK